MSLCNGPAILFLKGNLSSFTVQDISNCNMEAIQPLNAKSLLLYCCIASHENDNESLQWLSNWRMNGDYTSKVIS